VIGPFDRPGLTPDDVPGFVHDEPEDDEPLIVRLKRAHLRAHAKLKRAPSDAKGAVLLDIRKLEMCVKHLEMIEETLSEIQSRI
jgi:hypothetical protein